MASMLELVLADQPDGQTDGQTDRQMNKQEAAFADGNLKRSTTRRAFSIKRNRAILPNRKLS